MCRSAYTRFMQKTTTKLQHLPALHHLMHKPHLPMLLRRIQITWMWITGSVTLLLSTASQVWRELRRALKWRRPLNNNIVTWFQFFWPMIVLYLRVATPTQGRQYNKQHYCIARTYYCSCMHVYSCYDSWLRFAVLAIHSTIYKGYCTLQALLVLVIICGVHCLSS